MDRADAVFVLGVVLAAGGAWWAMGHPGAGLTVVGLLLAVLGIVAGVR